ncbi:MAG: phosphoenolpyruvate carboxylase [Actinomycetota bacterium]
MDELKIPSSMMTQHPDATKYIPIQAEPEEAIFSLTPPPEGLGLEEVMIDFEGKLTPYQQTSQIVAGLISRGVIPGRDVFVTPRIPSGREEGVFRQLMALMSVIESNYRAWKQSQIYAVREVILPMVSSPEELLAVRERVIDVINLAHKEFGLSKDPNTVQLIPLLETIPEILKTDSILETYIRGCKDRGLGVPRLRYFLGRSDSALSYGLVPSVLSVKIGIAKGYEVQDKTGLQVAPILGGGTLPFRGHFTLENLENILREYPGAKTLTFQSAMRYDHGYDKTRKMRQILQEKLPNLKPLSFDGETYSKLLNIIGVFTKHYLQSLSRLVEPIGKISDLIPNHRDRLTRKGEVGYARDLPHPERMAENLSDKTLAEELTTFKPQQTVALPRAISYTAAWYSIGLPPEIIGTGRGINEVVQRYGKDTLEFLLEVYPSLKADLSFAARFADLKNAREFLPAESLSGLEKDVSYIDEYLGVKCGPVLKEDELYTTILETMRPMLKEVFGLDTTGIVSDKSLEQNLIKEWIIKLGSIRGGLG